MQRRQAAFDYVKRAHRGEAFYLNSIRLRPAELCAHAQTTDPARNVRFLTLGLSVGKLLEGAGGAAAVRAFAQMMEEYEYHVASAAAQSMVRLSATDNWPISLLTHAVALFFLLLLNERISNDSNERYAANKSSVS